MPRHRTTSPLFIAAGALTIAGASILLAGAVSDTQGLPRPAEQVALVAAAPSLTTPAPTAEPPLIRVPPLANRTAVCETSLAMRAGRRAFEGAPPVIPHDVESFTSTKSCLDCHGTGFQMGTRVARAMPHPYLEACEQCHVTQQPPIASVANVAGDPLPDSTFEGLFRTGPATRAWAEAPPTMPHDTMMRTNCLACHGKLGYPGLQTSHPERTNCIQCPLQASH